LELDVRHFNEIEGGSAMLTIGGVGRWGSRIDSEAEMNGGGWQSSLRGHVMSVVGNNNSINAFCMPQAIFNASALELK
jgi:hypothetical protein